MVFESAWAVAGCLSARLFGGSLQHCLCHCAFEGASPSAGVLEILRSQLERCGPERLAASCPRCEACPSCLGSPEVVWLAVAFLLGVACTLLFYGSPPPRALEPDRRLSLAAFEEAPRADPRRAGKIGAKGGLDP